jgi:NADH-quinone oxidoreductase subunit J
VAERALFFILAIVAIVSAGGVVFSRNPVRSALLLVLNFFTLALIYFMLSAQFIGALQVIVYAGAIMVLFLFVIMLLNLGSPEAVMQERDLKRPLAYLIGFGITGDAGRAGVRVAAADDAAAALAGRHGEGDRAGAVHAVGVPRAADGRAADGGRDWLDSAGAKEGLVAWRRCR